MKNLEELMGLQEANGLLLLTTAKVEQACEILGKAHCRNLEVDNNVQETIWMSCLGREYVGGGVTEFPNENFRLHPHRAKVDVQLESEGFVTRIDFFIDRPTATLHYVAKKLLEVGFGVAVPTPAGTHFLEDWEIFSSVDGEPKVQKAAKGVWAGT